MKYCGTNVNVELYAAFGKNCELGNNSGISRESRLDGKIIMGENAMMGRECLFFAQNHAFSRTNVPMNRQGYDEEKPIYVGNDVWFGARIIVLGGVHIGDECVIGADAVVTKDIPSYSLAVENPAHVVKSRKPAE